MELWDYDLSMHGRAMFRRCEANDFIPAGYGRYGFLSERCGADAMRVVTWESRSTGGTCSVMVCDRHTLHYLGPMSRYLGEERS